MSNVLLDRYTIISELGSGGFAHVYLAHDANLQREVAIKCLPLDEQAQVPTRVQGRFGRGLGSAGKQEGGLTAAEKRFAAIIGADTDDVSASTTQTISLMDAQPTLDVAAVPGLEEARAAAHLNDANIVGIHDFQMQEGMAYLIMEYVEGVTVGDLMRQAPDAFDADVVAVIFKSVAHALQVAHASKVLHLDIKPDNVLITPKGQVKVVDFGLARLANEGGYGAATGGTVGYMPPEQMCQEQLDQRCDEWALASLTYHLITGVNPFIVDDVDKAQDAIYGAELVVPSLCMEGLDPSLDDILFCALEPYREDRYDTVKAFAKELQPCLGDTREGKKKLKYLVGHLDDAEDDDFAEDEPAPRNRAAGEDEPFYDDEWPVALPPFFDRASERVLDVMMRVWSVLNVGVLGFVGVSNLPFVGDWSQPFGWVLTAALMALAAVFPQVGGIAAVEVLGMSLVLCNAPIPGMVLMVLAAVWFAGAGRYGVAQTNTTLSVGLLGSFGGALLVPLLIGWFLRLRDTAACAAFAVLLAFMLGGLGSGMLSGWGILENWQVGSWSQLNPTYVAMFLNPRTWIVGASWVLAAVVMWLFCRFGRRNLVFLGTAAGVAVLAAGTVLAQLAYTGGTSADPGMVGIMSLVLTGVAMLLLAMLGCPDFYEEDED